MSLGDKPAFPHNIIAMHDPTKVENFTGLTLREHYAGLAMQGLIVSGKIANNLLAQRALFHADALIAKLEEKK